MASDKFFIEAVDVDDRDAVLGWVKEICSGVGVKEMAETLKVEPRLDVVVGEITDFLPDSIRAEAAEVCKASLDPRR